MRWIGRPTRRGQPFEHGEQVPAAVVAGEGVDLVDDDGAQAGEERPVVDVGADQHRLERLRRGQQDVGRLAQDALAVAGADVAVPERDPCARASRRTLEPRAGGC